MEFCSALHIWPPLTSAFIAKHLSSIHRLGFKTSPKKCLRVSRCGEKARSTVLMLRRLIKDRVSSRGKEQLTSSTEMSNLNCT